MNNNLSIFSYCCEKTYHSRDTMFETRRVYSYTRAHPLSPYPSTWPLGSSRQTSSYAFSAASQPPSP